MQIHNSFRICDTNNEHQQKKKRFSLHVYVIITTPPFNLPAESTIGFSEVQTICPNFHFSISSLVSVISAPNFVAV